MQEIQEKTARETELLKTLSSLEDLAEKKTKIYSRLLTEPSLAQEMESLSSRHKARKELLEKLAFGECPKQEKVGDRVEEKGEDEEK